MILKLSGAIHSFCYLKLVAYDFQRSHGNRTVTRSCDQISTFLTRFLIFSQFLGKNRPFPSSLCLVRNHSYSTKSHLQVCFNAHQTHILKKTFARGLVLKQRQKATRKWPIAKLVYSYFEKGCR